MHPRGQRQRRRRQRLDDKTDGLLMTIECQFSLLCLVYFLSMSRFVIVFIIFLYFSSTARNTISTAIIQKKVTKCTLTLRMHPLLTGE